MLLLIAGTPTSCISTTSINKKWTPLTEGDSKKACMSEHCPCGREKISLENLDYLGSFVVWIYTFSVAPKSWGREVSGLGLVPSETGQSKGKSFLEDLTLSPGGRDCADNWKMRSDLRDSEHRGEKPTMCLGIDGLHWQTMVPRVDVCGGPVVIIPVVQMVGGSLWAKT